MTANGPTQTLTNTQVEGFYAAAMEKMRERHDKGEPWEMAAAHVVIYMSDFDMQAVWAYVSKLPVLAVVDRHLAESLAKRLGLVIEWKRTNLVEA